MAEPGRARVSSDAVYQQLRVMILENRILPGERVNIDALARTLRVSQTPVREAIRRLEGDQLLHKVAGRGYRTAPLLNLDELRQLFEFRLVVEPWAVSAAAVNRLANPGAQLLAAVELFEEQSHGVDDIRRLLVEHDTDFHGQIQRALGNDVMRAAYEQTHCHFHTFRLYSPDIRGRATIEEHNRIARAIARCDVPAAETAMREHLTRAFRRFAAAFGAASVPGPRGPEDSPRVVIDPGSVTETHE